MTHMTRTCHPSIGLRHTQVGHVVPRIRQRGGNRGDVYVRLMKQPSHLLRAFHQVVAQNDSVPTSESEASLWMRSEVPARTFQGEGQCAVPKKAKAR